ncbi:MAG: hypothetical protein RR340_10485 [Cloacibacillus sp.]
MESSHGSSVERLMPRVARASFTFARAAAMFLLFSSERRISFVISGSPKESHQPASTSGVRASEMSFDTAGTG